MPCRTTHFLTVALLCALLGTTALAQPTITGTVRDTTGAPIARAEVIAQQDRQIASATTDQQGRFRLNAPFTMAMLRVSADGFAPVQQQWTSAAPEVSITLSLRAHNETVTVTATRIETPLRDTPSTVILDREGIRSSGAVTVDDVLRQVPGFTLFRRSGSTTSNPTTQGVSLRGLGASGASRALVMNDGVPLNDPFGGWVYWGRVPRESISAIDIVRGGTSDLYGTDALGGVINIRGLRPTSTGLTLESSIANRSTPFGSGTGTLRLGDWIGTLAAEGFRTGGYVPVPEDVRGPIDNTADSEHRTANADVERLLGQRARLFLRGSYYGESRNNGKIDERNSANIRQLSTGADWQSSLGNFGIRVFGGTEGLRQNFFAVSDDRSSEHITRDQFVPVQQIGVSAQWSRTVGSSQTLLAGVDTRWVEGESAELAFTSGAAPTSFLRNGGRQQTVGIFGEDLIRVGSRLLLTFAGRVDRWSNIDRFSTAQPLAPGVTASSTQFPDRNDTAFSPRASAVYKATDRISLHAAVYRSFRAPTLNELYRSFRVGSVLTLANPLLTAEHLTGGEAGIGMQLSDRITLRGTFFWNDIDGPVANVTLSVTPSLITRQRQNLGTTRSRGVEIETEARLSPVFSVIGGYQFADATVVEATPILEGNLVPQVPRHEFTMQARFNNSQLWTAAIQARYQGTQYDDDQNLLPLEKFFVLDAFVSKQVNPRVEVFAGGENLLNSRYTIGRTPVRTVAAPALVRVGVRLHVGAK